MDEEKFAELLDAEFQALRIGLKVITGFVSALAPNDDLALSLDGAVEELKTRPDVPPRTIEYLEQMAEVARKAREPR